MAICGILKNHIYYLEKAKEFTHNKYEITYTLPESKHTKSKLLKLNNQQAELFQIIFFKILGCSIDENRACLLSQLYMLVI
jgi:hypothetical protein